MTTQRIVRTSQPQTPVGIDWANPITRGLNSTYLPHIGDVVSGKTLPKVNAITAPGISGLGHTPTTPGTVGTGIPVTLYDTTALTQLLFFYAGASYGSYDNYCGSGSVNEAFSSGLSNTIQTWSIHGTNWNTGAAIWTNASGVSFYGSDSLVLARWDAAKNSGYGEVWRNGAKLANGSSVPLTTASNSKSTGSGGTNYRNGGPAGAKLYLRATWNRALSDAEIKSLSDNPWQIFQPIERPIFVSTSTEAANGHVSTALTGVTLTGAIGTLQGSGGATAVYAGQQVVSSIGTVSATNVANGTGSIVGLSATTYIGAVAAQTSASISLNGTQVSSAVGLLSSTGSASTTLAGISSSSSVGIVQGTGANSGNAPIIGVSSTSQVGAISADGTRSAVINITGLLSTGSVGVLGATVSASTTIGGVSSTSQIGTLSATATRSGSASISGAALASAVGTLNATTSVTITLNGIPVSTTIGNIQAQGSAITTLPSILATASIGAITASGEYPYTISLRYYYPNARNTILLPESRDNIISTEARDTYITAPVSRNTTLSPASRDNELLSASRNVVVPNPETRSTTLVSYTRTVVFTSPSRDT